jgi:hypothetical protein
MVVTVLLPSAGKRVQPSPEAQEAGMSPLEGELTLLAWEIDTVTLKPTDLLDLMILLPLPTEHQTVLLQKMDVKIK